MKKNITANSKIPKADRIKSGNDDEKKLRTIIKAITQVSKIIIFTELKKSVFE